MPSTVTCFFFAVFPWCYLQATAHTSADAPATAPITPPSANVPMDVAQPCKFSVAISIKAMRMRRMVIDLSFDVQFGFDDVKYHMDCLSYCPAVKRNQTRKQSHNNQR